MSDLIYKLRFKLHLWRNVPGMGLFDALRYPAYAENGDGDPIEDARSEMSYMGDG